MDEKDLKIMALLEEIQTLSEAKADLRVQVTILSNREKQHEQQEPPMIPLEGTVVDD